MYFSDEIADRMSGSSEYSPSCSKIGIGGRIYLYFLYVFFFIEKTMVARDWFAPLLFRVGTFSILVKVLIIKFRKFTVGADGISRHGKSLLVSVTKPHNFLKKLNTKLTTLYHWIDKSEKFTLKLIKEPLFHH